MTSPRAQHCRWVESCTELLQSAAVLALDQPLVLQSEVPGALGRRRALHLLWAGRVPKERKGKFANWHVRRSTWESCSSDCGESLL